MDSISLPPEMDLLRITQDSCSIESYVEEFLQLAHQGDWNDGSLKIVFWSGLGNHLFLQAPPAATPGSLAQYINHVLILAGSSFTVEEVPASQLPSAAKSVPVPPPATMMMPPPAVMMVPPPAAMMVPPAVMMVHNLELMDTAIPPEILAPVLSPEPAPRQRPPVQRHTSERFPVPAPRRHPPVPAPRKLLPVSPLVPSSSPLFPLVPSSSALPERPREFALPERPQEVEWPEHPRVSDPPEPLLVPSSSPEPLLVPSSVCSSQVPSSACSSHVPSSACSSQVSSSGHPRACSSSANPRARSSPAPSSGCASRAPPGARASRAPPSARSSRAPSSARSSRVPTRGDLPQENFGGGAIYPLPGWPGPEPRPRSSLTQLGHLKK